MYMLAPCRVLTVASVALCVSALVGCQSVERAPVSFSYVIEAQRGLPPGMDTIAIMPAKVGPTTDPKWSDMCVAILQSLVNESRTSFGTDVTVSDRRDTQVTFDEAELAAAGLSTTEAGGTGGKLLAAKGMILSNINVKIEKYIGKQRTLSGLGLAGFGGHGWGGGSADIRTREVETVTRNMTVQTEFKLIDTGNNQVWEHYSPKTFSATDRTKASPIFGSSQTEAELTPQDEIIVALVEQGAREFISRLMPCRINVDTVVLSSTNANCVRGVELLRGEMFDEAFSMFEVALADNPRDHRAAFGAGVAAEATGRYDEALRFYKRACIDADSAKYREARDRQKAYGHRVLP
jgi:hypothetical protein